MNGYTTRGQARIQQRDIETVVRTGSFMAGVSLAALERTRDWQAETELKWLLKQNGGTPNAAASLILMLRQSIGATLVRAGERVACTSASGASPGTAPVNRMLSTVD